MNALISDQAQASGLIAVSEHTPPIATPVDAEVDLAVLKSVPKQFEIKSEESANWLVRKIIAARDYGDRVKEWAAQEQRRSEREEQTLMFLFGRQIENWTLGEIEKLKGRRKSLALPGGTVGFRTLAASLFVDDEARVMDWARKSLPAAVVTSERLSRSELSAHLKDTGEIPASGAHVEPEKERFFVR